MLSPTKLPDLSAARAFFLFYEDMCPEEPEEEFGFYPTWMRMSHICPVSPLTYLSKGSKTSTGSIEDMGDPSEEELDSKSVVVDDPMMGQKFVTLDEHGPGAIQPQNIPAPKDMSAIERAKHFASDTDLMIQVRDMCILQTPKCTSSSWP